MNLLNPIPPLAVVVNDDPTQLGLLCGLLQKAGLEPRAFTRAEAALAEMSAVANTASAGTAALPALVVTDLYMPGIDGWRFCRLLRSPEYAVCNRVPILVVSATFSGDDAARIAADLGAEAFLASPVDSHRFCEQVRAILDGGRVRIPLRVLIVDDDALLCAVLADIFASHGYEAKTALTAQTAVEAFGKFAFDVAVLDYHLPDGTGDTLLDQFQARRPDCVCLMMTIDPRPELALDWMKRGAAAYLHKPIEPEYLLELCVKARRERSLLRVQDLLEMRTRELRASEQRFRSYFELPLIGLAITSPDKRWLEVNDQLCQTFGYAREQLLHMTWAELTHPEDLAAEVADFNRVLAGEIDGYTLEKRFQCADGRILPSELAVRCVRNPKGKIDYFVALVHDLTARKRAEADRAKLEAQLHQARKLESVGRLAGGVAHDFNNMLQAIQGNAGLALDELPPGSFARECLQEIVNCAQRSANLTRQLLAFARQQAITPQVLDLNETIASLLKMMRRLIGEDIELVWLPAAGLWLAKMDSTQVDQILANLCVNARDAIAGIGRIVITTANAVFDQAHCNEHPGFVPGEYVVLGVSDNGCGMDEETIDQIFEPFFTTKAPREGTGLGLATVYGIVRQNRGFIHVESLPGQGTTFRIHLPRHAGQAAAAKPEVAAATPKGAGETILLVEDEPAILEPARLTLERLGYRVLTASSTDEAIRLADARAREIQLLITDVVMPGMNGRDLAERLAPLHPKLKCLFMSGYAGHVIAPHGVLDEGPSFIQKPFSAERLSAKVRAVLDP